MFSKLPQLLTLLFVTQSLAQQQFAKPCAWEYLGCVSLTESDFNNNFPGLSVSNVMTPGMCETNCRILGTKFAVLFDGARCSCSRRGSDDPPFVLQPDASCNATCNGDDQATCGGPDGDGLYTAYVRINCPAST